MRSIKSNIKDQAFNVHKSRAGDAKVAKRAETHTWDDGDPLMPLTGAGKGCALDLKGCSKSQRLMEKQQPTHRHLIGNYLLICSIHIAG